MSDSVKCKECGITIVFVETRAGRSMPCNRKRITIVTLDGDVVQGMAPHWQDCPGAARIRKSKPRSVVKQDDVPTDEARQLFDELKKQLDEPEDF